METASASSFPASLRDAIYGIQHSPADDGERFPILTRELELKGRPDTTNEKALPRKSTIGSVDCVSLLEVRPLLSCFCVRPVPPATDVSRSIGKSLAKDRNVFRGLVPLPLASDHRTSTKGASVVLSSHSKGTSPQSR